MYTIKRLFALSENQKGKLYFAIGLSCLAELSGMIPYVVVVILINRLYEASLTMPLSLLLVAIAFLGQMFRLLLQHFATLAAHVATYEILTAIRVCIASKMLRVPMGVMLDTSSGYYKNLLVDIVEKIEDAFAHFIPEVIASIVAPLLCLIAIFYVDVRMGLISLINVPIGLFFILLAMRGYAGKSEKWNHASNDMNEALVEYVNGIEVIKNFHQESMSYLKYTNAIENYHDTTLDWWKQSWFSSAGVQAFLPTTLLGTLPMGAYFYMNHSISLSSFVICLVLPLGFIIPLMRLSKHTERFATMKTCIAQIDEFLGKKEIHRPSEPTKINDQKIVFRNVSFGYYHTRILHYVSFEIIPNTTTAIVGSSGSGKSTILKLIAGFWDIEQGSILFGDTPAHKLSTTQMSDMISYVTQDNFLFNISIKDNIKIGKPDADDDEIIKAATIAQCHDFIQALPQGYDTLAGDFGNRLSGGERQRITIARAVLKDSPIILLDEATSYTDPENDYFIRRAIHELVRNKTLITIAHRLGSITYADHILVMNKGCLVAQGKHPELLETSKIYRTLWDNYTGLDATGGRL